MNMGILDRLKAYFGLQVETVAEEYVETVAQNFEDQIMSLTKYDPNLKTLKVVELKALAKKRGLKRYSTLRKAELVNFLNDNNMKNERT